ncbi:MAG: CvpA family protein [Kiritimatiellae bacterium]|jgi:uncharacterized membrane protein required for colicin V production|nr:CvpA family protein [Kiritimatiellia bacterium]
MNHILDMFSPIDICFFICLLCGALWGMFKGLSGELAQLISTIICFFLSIKLTPYAADILEKFTKLTRDNALLIAIIIVVFCCFLLMFLLRKLFKKVLKVVIEVRYDKFLGFIAGIVHYSIILIILIVIMGLMPSTTIHRIFVEESFVGTNVMKLFPKVKTVIEERSNITLPEESISDDDKPTDREKPKRAFIKNSNE